MKIYCVFDNAGVADCFDLRAYRQRSNAGEFNHYPKFDISRETSTFRYLSFKKSKSWYFSGHPPLVDATSYDEYEEKEMDFRTLKYIYGYMHRPNIDFAFKIQNLVASFRGSSGFHSNLPCVWTHMRMDDRRLPDTDMIDWCKRNMYRDDVTGHYVALDPQHVSFTDIANYGCPLVLPYGAATIEHYLNASLVIRPDVTNIFVATGMIS